MPNHLKLILSIIVLAVTGTMFYIDLQAGGGFAKWVALLLGPLMVFSLWIFPEAKAKDIRKESAGKR